MAKQYRTPLGTEVFTTGQVAKLFAVSKTMPARWMERGMLRGYLVPGTLHRRVTREALLAFCQHWRIPVPDALQGENRAEDSTRGEAG